MTRKLVSVVTGTWQRHDLLMEMIDNVREQSYRPLEQVIVSDGPDPELRQTIAMVQQHAAPDDPPITFLELGRNWSSVLTDSMSAVPFGVAQWMARGEYITWLADDERWTDPEAVEIMVSAMEAADADYVYPKARIWWKGQPERYLIIGEPEPRFATITHVLHRADILDVPGGGFRTHVGKTNDWDQIGRWMAAGKRHAFVDRVLVDHRMDDRSMAEQVIIPRLVPDPLWIIAAECPRGAAIDIPAGWEPRWTVAASLLVGGFTLWTDGAGHWLRVDSEPIR